MKKFLAAALALFFFSGGAFSAVLDIGGDVQVRSLYRNNFDLTDATGSESWLDSYIRIYMDARPYPDVQAYLRLIGERDWAVEAEDETTSIDLDLGFLQFDNIWGSNATITLGRQELMYGEGFLVGRNEQYSTAKYERSPRKAFDAGKISFAMEPFTLDFFGSVIDEGFDEDSAILLGTNLHYDYLNTATLDFGIFYKDQDDDSKTIAFSIRGEADLERFPGLSVKAEVVPQIGDHSATRDLRALGGYLGVDYLFGHEHMSCVPHYVYANYYYLSGDDGVGDFGEFDPMFNDMFYGEVNQLNVRDSWGINTNARIINFGFGWNISRAVTLGFDLYRFKRDQAFAGSTDFGDEIDVKLTYKYNPDTELLLSAGYFSPEPALAAQSALQLYAGLKVAF